MVFGWLKPINTGPDPQLADPFCPRTILKNVVEYVVRTIMYSVGILIPLIVKLSPAS